MVRRRIGRNIVEVHFCQFPEDRDGFLVRFIQLDRQQAARLPGRVLRASQIRLQIRQLDLKAEHVILRRQSRAIQGLSLRERLPDSIHRVLGKPLLLLRQQQLVVRDPDPSNNSLSLPTHGLLLEVLESAGRAKGNKDAGPEDRLLYTERGVPLIVRTEPDPDVVIGPSGRIEDLSREEVHGG